ncbi:hypothetical protein SADUNF_Sadunf11G0098400 [Salix dunnii]|uniref:Phytocyanin domain-containing protein n=1 Tax=Salix dunnii TaxID=1413687 RepID=A0A835JMG1_9ROSI|nr:hypothetical protein SADUNF_Sadunf11G0098400 [Salix dunnii]
MATSITCRDSVFHIVGLLCFLLLIQKNNAFEFMVGDQKGWTVPDNTTSKSYLIDWAEQKRFQIGDTLTFVYDSSEDSVVQVTKEGYENCTATLTTLNENCPVATVKNGHTSFKFNKSGHHYFISGKRDRCQKNEKLVVIVLADRSRAPAASPPSPVFSGMVPAPTPSNEESPPPGPVETNPTPAPTTTVPTNSASSMFASFIGSMGAFFASSLILAI